MGVLEHRVQQSIEGMDQRFDEPAAGMQQEHDVQKEELDELQKEPGTSDDYLHLGNEVPQAHQRSNGQCHCVRVGIDQICKGTGWAALG